MLTRTVMPLFLCALAPLAGQDRVVLKAPGGEDRLWAPVLVWRIQSLDTTRDPSQEGRIEAARRRPGPGAVVEVTARAEDPARATQRLMELSRPQFRQAFQLGLGSGETSQLLGQFMSAETTMRGTWLPTPGSVHYNALIPESLRLESFLGVGGGTWKAQVGASSTAPRSKTYLW